MVEGKLNRSDEKGKEVGLARWQKPGALRDIFCSIVLQEVSRKRKHLGIEGMQSEKFSVLSQTMCIM